MALGAVVDVGISGAIVVADGSHEWSTRNAHDVERNRFFDTLRHELPQGNLGRNIFGHKDAVTAGDPSLLIVERVDFQGTCPVDGVARNPGGAVGVNVWNIVVMLAVIPGLATVSGGVNAVAVVFFFVDRDVASGVLA